MKPSFEFHSTYFNVTEPRDYFINPQCYGDDLAGWLIRKLTQAGIKATSEPQQEDFGWFFTSVVDDVEHRVIVGFQPNDINEGDSWVGWIEPKIGLLRSLFENRGRVLPQAVQIIDAILSSASEITELKWSLNSEI